MPPRDSHLAYGYFESPVGLLLVAGDADRRHRISFPSERPSEHPQADWRRDDGRFADAFRQLRAYFAGDLTRFDLPLRFAGTEFQNRVWAALVDIPFGETLSYTFPSARRCPMGCSPRASASRARAVRWEAPTARTLCPSSFPATG